MASLWATDEMTSVELGVTRLDQRLTQILSGLGERPAARIPAACGGYAEWTAAYCVRWVIEVFFRTLKSGCRVEGRRFGHVDRLARCLAVYEVVAWRTLYACRSGRSCPGMSCEAVFEPSEWKSVWMAVHQTSPPRKPPWRSELVRLIAPLGGDVNRPERADSGRKPCDSASNGCTTSPGPGKPLAQGHADEMCRTTRA